MSREVYCKIATYPDELRRPARCSGEIAAADEIVPDGEVVVAQAQGTAGDAQIGIHSDV